MILKKRWLVWVIALIAVAAIVVFVLAHETSRSSLCIGCITPLTGEGATYGAATKRGVDLALKKVNASGGVNGVPLEIIYEDDQMNAKIATNAIQKLATVNKVPVIIGAFGSSITLAIAPIAEEKRVVLFSASSTADAIRDAGDYVFRNVPPNGGQGKTAAEFVLKHLDFSRACMMYMNNDYGVSLSQSFNKYYLQGGGEIVCSETYNPGTIDFRAQLTKINSHTPQVVFFPGHYQESGLILKQAKELGLKATFVGGDGSYSPELLKIAGGAAEGSFYTLMATGLGASKKLAEVFRTEFKAAYGDEPDVYAAYAYDALLILAEALRNGGTTADRIKAELYAMRGYQGVTGVTEFDDHGEVDKPYGIYKVHGTEFIPVEWTRENK